MCKPYHLFHGCLRSAGSFPRNSHVYICLVCCIPLLTYYISVVILSFK
uniref:Uncharacterized protein n=1 Tax=Populus trichocarpa TaxID=3694 RepID=A9PC85_POPTR|nr:unknown [Populus trichocarpa]